MLIKLLISIPIGLLVTYLASQLLITSATNSARYQTQTNLNVFHANALTLLNNSRNLRIGIGLISKEDSETNLVSSSTANVSDSTDLKTCLGSVGIDCQAKFDNQTIDLSTLATSGNAKKSGSSTCTGTVSCPFKQTIIGKWNCDQPQRCSQLNITIQTVDLKNTTKYNTLSSTLTIPARSLLGRSQINFTCASNARSFFIHNLDYVGGQGSCEPVIHVNSIGTVQNAVPARGVAADNFNQVRNAPDRQSCATGFAKYQLYAGTSDCLQIDPNLVAGQKPTSSTPVPTDPTPAPVPSATPCQVQLIGPDGTVYDAGYAFPRCDENGKPKPGGANICPGWNQTSCTSSQTVADPTPCPMTCVGSQGNRSCYSTCDSSGSGSGGKDSGAGGGAGVGGGSGGAGGGASGTH